MDSFEAVLALLAAAGLSAFVGVIAYASGVGAVRDQAIAAGVACYVVVPNSDKRPEFSFRGCK